jgi:5-formyltetrahydrofolate cyclo-ligase
MANEQTAAAKRITRRAVRAALAGMTQEERNDRSQRICRQLLLWFGTAQTVALCAPRRDEPDLRLLGELEAYPDRVFLFPRIDGSRMVFVRTEAWSELRPGQFGLGTPIGPAWAQPPQLVVVPGLAFDRTGRRLGRGTGFYDRYLALLPRDTRTSGVGFAHQLFDEIPHEAHDIPLHVVITEDGWVSGRGEIVPIVSME